MFSALRNGERELIVLRSDDGEGWKEHAAAVYDEDEGAFRGISEGKRN
jgi:hypothetical protein